MHAWLAPSPTCWFGPTEIQGVFLKLAILLWTLSLLRTSASLSYAPNGEMSCQNTELPGTAQL